MEGVGAPHEGPFARLSSHGAGAAGAWGAAVPVPGHRIGPVVQALLLLARREGTGQLTRRLAELVPVVTAPAAGSWDRGEVGAGWGGRYADAQWWATRLLSGVLLRVPDATPSPVSCGCWPTASRNGPSRREAFAHTGLEAFGPWFWRCLPLSDADRMDLLRRLLPADGPPAIAVGSRTAGAVGRREEAGSVGPGEGTPERQAAGGSRSASTGRGDGRAAKSPVGGAVECPDGEERTAEGGEAEGCSVAELYTEAWAEEGGAPGRWRRMGPAQERWSRTGPVPE